jgi:hypothetical protein
MFKDDLSQNFFNKSLFDTTNPLFEPIFIGTMDVAWGGSADMVLAYSGYGPMMEAMTSWGQSFSIV